MGEDYEFSSSNFVPVTSEIRLRNAENLTGLVKSCPLRLGTRHLML